MKKDKMNEVCSLAVEFVQEFKELPVDDYMRIKLIMLAGTPTNEARAFLQRNRDTDAVSNRNEGGIKSMNRREKKISL